jgi:hypothetical protein
MIAHINYKQTFGKKMGQHNSSLQANTYLHHMQKLIPDGIKINKNFSNLPTYKNLGFKETKIEKRLV